MKTFTEEDLRWIARRLEPIYRAKGWTWGDLDGNLTVPDEQWIYSMLESLQEKTAGDDRVELMRCGRIEFRRERDGLDVYVEVATTSSIAHFIGIESA